MADRPLSRTYVFEPRDSSVLLGLSAVQCGLVGVGLTLFAVSLTAGLPVPAAAIPAAVTSGAAFARAGGRPLWQWLVLGALWLPTRARGRRWCAALPLRSAGVRGPSLPPCLAGIDIVDAADPDGSSAMGVVRDRAAGTATALVRVEGTEFALAPAAEQDRLLGGWGDVLAGLARDRAPVTHLTWSDFAAPSQLAEHRAWLTTLPTASGGDDSAAMRSYRELLAEAATTATRHDVIVAITVDQARLGRTRRRDVDASLLDTLRAVTADLDRSLRAAGLHATAPLSAAAIGALLRARIDPFARPAAPLDGRLTQRLQPPPGADGPVAVETGWANLRLDGAWHRTYWVQAWPQRPQDPAWLEPFLADASATRTFTVVFAPVPAHASDRRINREVVRLDSDAEARAEKGRRITARHQRARAAVDDREAELVAGYAEMAYLGLLTVTAPTQTELDASCDGVEQLARRHGLDVRSLDARQDLAWAAALPFGLAPRTLAGP